MILDTELDIELAILERELDGTSDDELERELLEGVVVTEELEREIEVTTDELERDVEVVTDELERLLVVATLDEVAQFVTPKGAGWLAQVVRDTQLLPFS